MKKQNRLFLVMLLNLIIVIVEVGAGIISHSMGLVADALHNLSDVAAIFVAWLAMYFSTRQANERMTWGYIRSEMMAGFINSLVLVGAMGIVVFESIQRLIQPVEIQGPVMMAVAGVAMLANILSLFVLKDMHLHGGHIHSESEHSHDHKHEQNINIKAAVLHLLSDVGISAAVLIGGILVTVGRWYWLDPVLSLSFSVYIIFEAVKILRTAFVSLMDASRVSPEELETILSELRNQPGVLSLHDVHITQPSSEARHFSAHVVLQKNLNLAAIDNLIASLKKTLEKFHFTHTVLQPESEAFHREDILCCRH